MRFTLSSIRRSRNAAVLAAGGVALALGLVGSAIATPLTGPFEVDDGTDSFAIKGYTYTSANATGVLGYGGNSSATNATGVAGYVTSPLSVGVTGYAASTGVNAYGVYGYSNTGNGVYGVSNTAAAASIYGLNSIANGTGVFGYASGTGILGESTATNGIVGVTGTASTTSHYAGVIGLDFSSAGTHYGVAGESGNGYGVYATSSGGEGIYATSSTGEGVYATSTNGDGVYGSSSTASGVVAVSGSNIATFSVTNATATPSPGECPCTNNGVYAQSTEGVASYGVNSHSTGAVPGFTNPGWFAGVYGYGNDGPGVVGYSKNEFGGYFNNNNNAYPTLFVNSTDTASGGYEIAASSGSTTNFFNFFVSNSGNLYASGSITSGTNTFNAKVTGSNTLTYATQAAEATVEDFGTAQMVGGSASVTLAPDFRKTIDTSAPYMVFLTPYGDNRGLYIASRTANGFTVREAQSGRSSIAFDYRIVARPYGARLARLPQAQTIVSPKAISLASGANRARVQSAAQLGIAPGPLVRTASAQSRVGLNAITVGTFPKRLPQPAANFLKH